MDILLTHGYFLENDPAEQRVMKPYVPLGILSLSAHLDRLGFTCSVFDSTFSSLQEFARTLARERPPVVGIYINMMTKFAALSMISLARQHGARVIIGGPEPPHYAAQFLDHGADLVVVGEAEQTLAEILTALREGCADWTSIAGLIFRDAQGREVRTPARTHLPDIDLLPFPDRSKVDLALYLDAWRRHHGYSSLSIITMRGCPFTCTWCSHAVYGESYRRRSPARVVDEIELLLNRYHPDAFWFADDVFTINHGWLFAFDRELQRRNLKIRYECITRADRMNEQVVEALRSSGCTRLWIGSESGSQRILDAMSRRVKATQVRAMTALARDAGIQVGMFIMLGYDGETREDIELTVRHLKASRPDLVLTTVAYPIKGTAFYRQVESRLRIPDLPFDQWNDRMIDIGGRYSKRFYWFANRRVINEAAWSRMLHAPSRPWHRIAGSFLKAKAAQLGMYAAR